MFSNVMMSHCIGLFLVLGQACNTLSEERTTVSHGPVLTPLSRGHWTREGGTPEVVTQTAALDLNSDPVLRKLNSCCRHYLAPVTDSNIIMSKSDAKDETLYSTCNSLLLAILPRRLHNKRNRNVCRQLAVKVCSILETGRHASINNTLNETYSSREDEITEQNNFTRNKVLTNRKKRYTSSDIFDGIELLQTINELSETSEMDSEVQSSPSYFGLDIKTEILDNFINGINNKNMALERPADYVALAGLNEQKYNSNESSHLARDSMSKRVKVRPGFFSGTDHKGAQKLAEERLMKKLQLGSAACALKVESILLAVPGCIPKSILATRCQGSCPSWSAPEWRDDSLVHVERCTCCVPLQFKTKVFALDCPPAKHMGHATVRQISVPYPFKCTCRPCENAPEIKAEQPYDY